MKFINEYHKQHVLHNLKQIEEWRKYPVGLQVQLQRQRKREQQAKEMEDQKMVENPKKNDLENGKVS
jgi:hypothetical protein